MTIAAESEMFLCRLVVTDVQWHITKVNTFVTVSTTRVGPLTISFLPSILGGQSISCDKYRSLAQRFQRK
jgi:hypothetical protein